MESVERGKAALLSGIQTDVRAEQQQIVDEAEKQAAEKRKYAEKRIVSMLSDARQEAEKQAEAAKRRILSRVGLEIKRRSMRVRDEVIRDIMGRVEEKLNSMIADWHYRSVLTDWITEAAIGLEAESAQINASEQERALIDDEMLSEVKARTNAHTGRQVTVTLSDSQPLKLQGVVLTAADGRTAFNNQIETRILQNQRKIQALIYDTLFTGNREEQS